MKSDPITGHWFPVEDPMSVTERKSKYKYKVTISPRWAKQEHNEIIKWCESTFGPGGRKMRWRFGWTDTKSTYYFRSDKDVSFFLLRWSDDINRS